VRKGDLEKNCPFATGKEEERLKSNCEARREEEPFDECRGGYAAGLEGGGEAYEKKVP